MIFFFFCNNLFLFIMVVLREFHQAVCKDVDENKRAAFYNPGPVEVFPNWV